MMIKACMILSTSGSERWMISSSTFSSDATREPSPSLNIFRMPKATLSLSIFSPWPNSGLKPWLFTKWSISRREMEVWHRALIMFATLASILPSSAAATGAATARATTAGAGAVEEDDAVAGPRLRLSRRTMPTFRAAGRADAAGTGAGAAAAADAASSWPRARRTCSRTRSACAMRSGNGGRLAMSSATLRGNFRSSCQVGEAMSVAPSKAAHCALTSRHSRKFWMRWAIRARWTSLSSRGASDIISRMASSGRSRKELQVHCSSSQSRSKRESRAKYAAFSTALSN
mmetsp:Transcript_168084/g.539792  ORF Transcript_168084/g.539792 Transcript_168084/m.539792 type:complete len:288 (+) Transcript_168084:2000-2863(+)